jgi:hypothetical protein
LIGGEENRDTAVLTDAGDAVGIDVGRSNDVVLQGLHVMVQRGRNLNMARTS